MPFQRTILGASICGTVALLLTGGACLAAPKTITVAADGSGDYKTLQDAIAAVPAGSADRTTLHIKPGTYPGPIIVPKDKPNVTFEGDDAKTTVLTYDKNVNDPIPAGVDKFNPSVQVLADGFHADNVTMQNTSGDHGQALALRLDGDKAILRHCRLTGWQDTLMVNNGRDYFADDYIEGRVDFIYGSATAWFEKCEIHSKNGGHITAASTPQDHPYGFVFHDCTLTGDPNPWIAPDGTSANKRANPQADLGRPWRPYASVTYLNCTMGSHILPAGWNNWRNPDNEKTARYGEYASAGPGANPAQRVTWAKQLTKDQAAQITVANVLGGADGWDPAAQADTAPSRPAVSPSVADTAGDIVTKTASSPSSWSPDAKVKIVLAGDSTVTDGAGWATGFKELLKPGTECINLAKGGRSSKSFRDEGSWAKVLALKPDYVLIQFGHNDQPGHGPARETDPQTTYYQNMARYVDEAREAGIKTILVTPLTRREFGPDGKIHSRLAPYAEAVRKVAAEKHVPLVDLQALSIAYFDKLGPKGWQTLAPPKGVGYDGTHLNHEGSERVGRIVVDALRTAVPEIAADLN